MKKLIRASEDAVSIYSDEYKSLVRGMSQTEKNGFLRTHLQEDITFAMHYAEDSVEFINNVIEVYQESADRYQFLDTLIRIFTMEK